jgi:putative endonuclease
MDKTWYIGYTTDLQSRIKDHNQGKNISTKKKKPWKLIYAELYLNKMDALGREKFLKSGSGRKFLKKQISNYLNNN